MSRILSEICNPAADVVSNDVRTNAELEHVQMPEAAEKSKFCAGCVAAMALNSAPRLMPRNDADRYLALSADAVDWLIKTGQITVIRIRGQERFDRRDLDLLIEAYKKTALRRGR